MAWARPQPELIDCWSSSRSRFVSRSVRMIVGNIPQTVNGTGTETGSRGRVEHIRSGENTGCKIKMRQDGTRTSRIKQGEKRQRNAYHHTDESNLCFYSWTVMRTLPTLTKMDGTSTMRSTCLYKLDTKKTLSGPMLSLM